MHGYNLPAAQKESKTTGADAQKAERLMQYPVMEIKKYAVRTPGISGSARRIMVIGNMKIQSANTDLNFI